MPRSTRLIDNECYPQMPGRTRLIDSECYPQMPGSTRLIDDENDECYPQMPGSTHQKPTSDTYRMEFMERPHRERQITGDTYRTNSRIVRSGLTVEILTVEMHTYMGCPSSRSKIVGDHIF